MNRFLVVWIMMQLAICGYGQPLNLRFEHITTEHGLPQSTIHGIVKDKYGFIWFGTWSGLCRYDGYRMRVYQYEPGNPRSIVNSRIHNIIKDNEDQIWVDTFDDKTFFCKYNYETDDFDRVPREDVSADFRQRLWRRGHRLNISFTYQDHRWNLDHNTNLLVETYLPTGQKKSYATNPASRWALNDAYVSDIYLDDQDILWLGTYNNGVNKANLKAKPFEYYHHDPTTPHSIIDNNVRAICEDLQGNLWIGTRDKGITIVGKDGKFRHLRNDPTRVNSINYDQIKTLFCDSRGYMWIGTKNGLDSYNPATGRIRRFEMLDLLNTPVYGITQDQNGNVWFATWNGVYKYETGRDRMQHFEPDTIVSTKHTHVIRHDRKGNIWVGTEGRGISVFRESEHGGLSVIQHFVHDSNLKNTISDNRAYAIYEDRGGFVWIGTGNGLDRYDPATKSFMHFSISANGLANGSIAGITEDDNGFIWVSHKRGISQIDSETLTIRNYSQQDGLQSNEFLEGSVFKSRFTNKFYFGGNSGYTSFHPDSIRYDPTTPQVVLTELQVLNKPVAVNSEINGRVLLEKPLYLKTSLDLNHRDKSIAIEFAGLHYANPTGNKYAYMLEGFDADWIYTDASHRVAAYSNLAPGNYVFKVKASNSDGVWNDTPTTLQVTVAPALWASTWAYLVYAFIIAGLLYASYYYLVRYAKLSSKLAYETILHEKEREHHESKVQFFTNISHEIKTPLSLILAPIQQLMGLNGNNSAMNYQLRTMKANGNRLLKLVNQLLDIRRLETGNEQLMPERRDMVEFVHEIIDSFHHVAQMGKIILTETAEITPIYNHFDPDKLEKVLCNLLSNAFKFTKEGGQIDVVLSIEEHSIPCVAIEVTDNGQGIAPEDLPRIFEPFQQGKLNKAGGTGLGLAYSKSLVELHGGTIDVQSTVEENSGNRTSFYVRIPLRTEGLAASPQVGSPGLAEPVLIPADEGVMLREPVLAAATEIPAQHKRYTLLLVEDNYEMRKYLRECFTGQYHIIEASNGIEGLAATVKHTPDLIVSDVTMPEMDGIAFCKKIKADILTSHIPFILLTARTLIEYEIEGIRTGADDYIVKPFNVTLLTHKITNLLDSRARLKEKFRNEVIMEPSKLNPVSPDERLLKKVVTYIEDQLAEPGLSVDDICAENGLSRTQLYRKMKALTGLSVMDIIKETRLKRAQHLLGDRKFNINEITYMTGFSDPDYFRKCFKARFGFSPSEYSKQGLKNETETTSPNAL